MPVTDFDCPPFVGALLIDDAVVGTAFVCVSPHLVVTCAHSIPEEMTDIVWRGADGVSVPLRNWKVMFCDRDLDIAVITSGDPILADGDVAEMPRRVVRRGVKVFFNAVSEYLEPDGIELPFDSGEGEILGPNHLNGLVRAKLRSKDVTPGCSGAPVLHYSDVGITVVGMISGRYNSVDGWNRDTAWLVLADHLKEAVARTDKQRRSPDGYLGLTVGAGDGGDIWSWLRESAAVRTRGAAGRFVSPAFRSNATSDDFIPGLKTPAAKPLPPFPLEVESPGDPAA